MYKELTFSIGTKKHRAILQDGFYTPSAQTPRLHRHSYGEIHVLTGAPAKFNIGGKLYSSAQGNLLLIPPDVFHCFVQRDENTFHTAFQVDLPAHEFAACQISHDIVRDFLQQIEESAKNLDYTKVSAYMGLFASCFPAEEPVSAQPMTDYGVMIRQFFSARYNEDLHLSDLAQLLNLSQRQAERLVIQYTGHTFREELTAMRVSMAYYLLQTSAMSLNQIAQYVGYRSYAGFWKAMKKDAEKNGSLFGFDRACDGVYNDP